MGLIFKSLSVIQGIFSNLGASVLAISKHVQLLLNPVRNEDNKSVSVWTATMYKTFLYLLIHFCPKPNCLYCCITCRKLKITYSGPITRCVRNMMYLNPGGSIQGFHVI